MHRLFGGLGKTAFPTRIELCREPGDEIRILLGDVTGFCWIVLVVVEFGKNRLVVWMSAVFPEYQAVSVCSHGVTHQMVFE